MPHFMRKGKHAVDGIVMVEQNKGMYAVAAPGIRTAALALVFVNINPAAFHTVRQSLAVLLAHYLQCLFYGCLCLLVRNLDICIGTSGTYKSYVLQFIYAQLLFAQGNIAVQQGRLLLTVSISVSYTESGILSPESAISIAEPYFLACAKKASLLQMRHRLRRWCFLCGIDRIEIFERLLTNGAVGAFQEGYISALCQLQFFSRGSADRRE